LKQLDTLKALTTRRKCTLGNSNNEDETHHLPDRSSYSAKRDVFFSKIPATGKFSDEILVSEVMKSNDSLNWYNSSHYALN